MTDLTTSIKHFTSLNRAPGAIWTEATNRKAPHKPILLGNSFKQYSKDLAGRLSKEFGKGFDYSNVKNMRQFYLTFPIGDALRSELSWTHYRLLMRENSGGSILN